MPRRQCRQCPDIQFCLSCVINAPLVHPDHDIDFKHPQTTTGSGPGEDLGSPSRSDRSISQGHELHGDTQSEEPEVVVGAHEKDSMCIPKCCLCQAELFELRYDCLDCSEHFCYGCRKLHLRHTLRIATGPLSVSDSEEGSDVQEVDQDGTSRRRNRIGGISHSDTGHCVELGMDSSSDIEAVGPCASLTQLQAQVRRSDISISRKDFAKMARTMKVMVEAAQQIKAGAGIAEQAGAIIEAADHMKEMIGATGRTTKLLESPGATVPDPPQSLPLSLPQSLLNFPIEVATLHSTDDDDAVDARDDEDEMRELGVRRRWGPRERRQLKELKSQGLTDRQIGLALGRTASAVSQQWRKQQVAT